jgi:hypothetical protein
VTVTPVTEFKAKGRRDPLKKIEAKKRRRLISRKELLERVPLSYPRVWQLIREKKFPVFNAEVFSDVKDTDRLLTDVYYAHADGLCYRPGGVVGVINVKSRALLNTWRKSDIAPAEDYKPGDEKPFTDFLEHLIPEEYDRREMLRWGTTLVVSPSTRMHYSVLMISEDQGVGKTTLAVILAKLVGMHNTSFPSESEITDSQSNDWIAHRVLAVISEIFSGDSKKAYNRNGGSKWNLEPNLALPQEAKRTFALI